MPSDIIGLIIVMVVAILVVNVLIWVRYELLHIEYTKV